MAKLKICVSFILLFSFLLYFPLSAYELSETSLENQHYDDGKVFKERNPTSSDDLEIKSRGGSSMPSSNHFVRQGYKTPSLEETGKGNLLKDIGEVDKLGLENRKWYWNIGFGDGNDHGSNGIGGGRSNGGIGSSNGQGDIYRGSGGRSIGGGIPWSDDIWGRDILYDYYYYYFPEPLNYKETSVMRHHNMKKLSDFDRESFRESQTKKIGIKNGGKVHYDGVPRMEDIDEEKRN